MLVFLKSIFYILLLSSISVSLHANIDYYKEGKYLFEHQRYESAYYLFLQHSQKHNVGYKTYTYIGDCLFQLHRTLAALKTYKKSIELNNNQVRLLHFIGDFEFTSKRYLEAIKYYALWKKKEPKNLISRLRYELAYYLKHNKFTLKISSSEIKRKECLAFEKTARTLEAQNCLINILKLNIRNLKVLSDLARLERIKLLNKNSLKPAKVLKGGWSEVLYLLSGRNFIHSWPYFLYLIENKKIHLAEKEIIAMQKNNPNDAMLYFFRAALSKWQGNKNKAKDTFLKGYNLLP